jgi:hypothetical protein
LECWIIYFEGIADMRLSCPPAGSGSTLKYIPLASDRNRADKEPPLPPSYLHSCQQQTSRLNGLYQLSKNRNHRLLQVSLNLSRDLNFLREYCKCLELELEANGFYKQKNFERLSRRETAASIFESYSDSESLLSEWRDEDNAEQELKRLRSRNSSLESENKALQEKVS